MKTDLPRACTKYLDIPKEGREKLKRNSKIEELLQLLMEESK
jgi:hypothetical protein